MQLTAEQCWEHLRDADHAVLCTANAKRTIDAVPVCFATVRKLVASPIDLVKAKATTDLGRIKNLDLDAAATLLCERWDRDDWSRLWWVRVQLLRRPGHDVSSRLFDECAQALRDKYHQYQDAEFADVIVFDVQHIAGWSATETAVSR